MNSTTPAIPLTPCLCNSQSHLCTCPSDLRSVTTEELKLYPHVRKFYSCDTNLLEHVHIMMSTIKPETVLIEENLGQPRRRRTRMSKQRAKILITEYCCTKKLSESMKFPVNKRDDLSFWIVGLSFHRLTIDLYCSMNMNNILLALRGLKRRGKRDFFHMLTH